MEEEKRNRRRPFPSNLLKSGQNIIQSAQGFACNGVNYVAPCLVANNSNRSERLSQSERRSSPGGSKKKTQPNKSPSLFDYLPPILIPLQNATKPLRKTLYHTGFVIGVHIVLFFIILIEVVSIQPKLFLMCFACSWLFKKDVSFLFTVGYYVLFNLLILFFSPSIPDNVRYFTVLFTASTMLKMSSKYRNKLLFSDQARTRIAQAHYGMITITFLFSFCLVWTSKHENSLLEVLCIKYIALLILTADFLAIRKGIKSVIRGTVDLSIDMVIYDILLSISCMEYLNEQAVIVHLIN